MNCLATQEEILSPKSFDLVDCVCYQCDGLFKVTKNTARRSLLGQKSVRFCSRRCAGEFHAKIIITKQCLFCNKAFSVSKKVARQQKFCSKKCGAKSSNSKRKKFKNCAWCKNPIPSWGKEHCSRTCSIERRKDSYLQNWAYQDGCPRSITIPMRVFLLSSSNNACSKCGWNRVNVRTNKTTLQIHHIDGDAKNNRRKNLEVLCPNCHSLTDNFGCKNTKSSRVTRYVC